MGIYYSIIFFLPFIILVIGFLMWIIPARKKYSFSYDNDTKNIRQYIGKALFFIGALFCMMQMSVEYQSKIFTKNSKGHYYYKVFELTPDTAIDSTNVKTDSLIADTVKIVSDTAVKISLNQEVCIPYTEKNGCKYIKLTVKSAVINAIFDTGCGTQIAFAPNDYYKVVGTGIVKENDFTGSGMSEQADGTTFMCYSFVLPECTISNLTKKNVHAECMSSGNETLVGGPFFDNYTVTIDNVNKQIVLKK